MIPDKTPLVTKDLSKNFINSVPQLAIYALIIEEVFGLEVKCVMFNEEGVWEFDPEILHDITKWYHDNKISNKPLPWELYF